MQRSLRVPLVAAASLALLASLFVACFNQQPEQVFGPGVSGDSPPTLEIVFPAENLTLNRGERFDIDWRDSDSDSNARISFDLINADSGFSVSLVSNIPENDSAANDFITVSTSLIPAGTYFLQGTISDGVNPPVSVFALLGDNTSSRVRITVGEAGSVPSNVPPRIAITEPNFNLSVTQDDLLTISTQPTDPFDTDVPYDPDSDTTIIVMLDFDEDPSNDDPQAEDYNTNPSNRVIVLGQTTVEAGLVSSNSFPVRVDLSTIPPREDGSPYYIRATIFDETNPATHAYADGTINIVRSAVGTLDLATIGKTVAGVRFVGFNPGSHLGTEIIPIGDFDDDGVDDFLLVAQFGNPRNFGNIGEAYIIYGLNAQRFGGEINVNTVSTDVSGVIVEAPPNRLSSLHAEAEYDPQGITSAAIVSDITGDGRPEILFGAPMADGIYEGRDDDPGDDAPALQVRIDVRQGLAQRYFFGRLDDGIDDDFEGVVDTYVDRSLPNSSFGDEETLEWAYNAATEQDTRVTLITWDLSALSALFTTLNPDDVEDLSVTLQLNGTGDPFEAYSFLSGVTEDVSWNDYGVDGPQPDVHYEEDELERTGNSVDLTDVFQEWLDGELAAPRPAVLIRQVRTAQAGTAFSSESDFFGPLLTVTYGDTSRIESFGCYPDNFVNNQSTNIDDPGDGIGVDSTLFAGGFVSMLSSENRDASPAIDGSTRLESTVVAMELMGQETVGGGIGAFTNVTNFDEDQNNEIGGAILHEAAPLGGSTTAGARIMAGWWDFISDSTSNNGQANPRADRFGQHVASMPDVNNNRSPELLISAPWNERYMATLEDVDSNTADYRINSSTAYRGSVVVVPGFNYGASSSYVDPDGNVTLPGRFTHPGSCTSSPRVGRSGPATPSTGFEIFAESINDYLGGAEYAGDVNLDGVPDIVCGAPLNDHPDGIVDTGALYIIYGRTPVGNVFLENLDNPAARPPSLRIRGETAGDRIGHVQNSGLDVNGDRVDDVFIGSPWVDFGGVAAPTCGDINGDGSVTNTDFDLAEFSACRNAFGDEVYLDDACKMYDFDNDRDIDDEDRQVFDCLVAGFGDCCPVDNGFVAVIFGDVNLDGDRDLSQIATRDLPGIRFFGANAGDRAGMEVVSAGDFNRDGYGDLLISAPGVRFVDDQGRDRMGVAYLIFGGTHLNGNLTFSLSQVGSPELPGMVIQSPFVAGRPNEAPIEHVGGLGDINNDGFDDIGIGIPRADFLDSALPQDPNSPGTDPNIGRRPDDGNVYIIYGNNTGSNRV